MDGAWVGAEQVHESINPATYEVIGAYPDGGLEAARVGIAVAKRAFQTSVCAIDDELRERVIGQIADAFERHRGSLLDLLAAENGKVKGEAGFELDKVPSKLQESTAIGTRRFSTDAYAIIPTIAGGIVWETSTSSRL